MNKKITYGVVGVLSAFLIFWAGLFTVTRFIDPNTYKTKIIESVKQSTGRDLIIAGELKWSFFPGVGIEANQVSLSNRSGFSPATFASIETLNFDLAIMPLIFSRSVVLNDLSVDGAVIHLTTLSNGKTNWDDLLGAPSNVKAASTTSSSTDHSINSSASNASNQSSSFNFNIGELELENSSVVWDDQQKNQHWNISELSVNADNLGFNHEFPITISGKVVAPATQVTSYWDITTKANVDPDKKYYEFNDLTVDGDLKGSSIPKNHEKIQLKLSQVQYDGVSKLFTVNDLSFNGFGSHATGNLTSGISNNTSGKFHVDQILLGQFKTTDVVIPVTGDKGIYHFNPVTSKLYDGTFNANVTLNTTPTKPQWQVNYQISGTQLSKLLKEAFDSNRFSGVGTMNGKLTAAGSNSDQLVSSLAGSTHIEIAHGTLEGVDIGYWWHVGDKLAKGNPTAVLDKNTKRTEIVDMTADFAISNGIAQTQNLVLYNNAIYVKGQGQIDLVNEMVNMKLFVSKNSNGKPTGQVIPLIVSGKLGDASVKIDEAALAVLVGKIAGNILTQGASGLANEGVDTLAAPVGNVLNKLLGK